LNTNYELVLKKQKNKFHQFTDNNWKKVRVYKLEICDKKEDKEDCVKVRLKITKPKKQLPKDDVTEDNEVDVTEDIEVDVTVDVIEDNFQNIHFNYPKDYEFIRIKQNGIIETLKYILELLKKDIKDEDFVGKRYKEFKPYYSRTPNILNNKDEE
jgi:hypothetical protein